MNDLYPEIEPHAHGTLDVGDGHRVYWEICGNPDGTPAVVFHGGPGSGCTPRARRYFDPSVYRIVLFDQRSCGRSTPHASMPGVDLASNTTAHLLRDIESLRVHLGIGRWLVFAGSWGSTLALAYATKFPDRVSALILWGTATTTRAEIEWVTRGARVLLPEAWAQFRDGASAGDADASLVDAYHRLLVDPDVQVHEKAARDWCDWEMALVARPGQPPDRRWDSAGFRLAFARLVTHYWRHGAWLDEGILLRQAGRLAGIPGVLVHGRLDLASPLATPWHLSRAWPGSELVVIDAAGHDSGDAGMRAALVAATDRFRPDRARTPAGRTARTS